MGGVLVSFYFALRGSGRTLDGWSEGLSMSHRLSLGLATLGGVYERDGDLRRRQEWAVQRPEGTGVWALSVAYCMLGCMSSVLDTFPGNDPWNCASQCEAVTGCPTILNSHDVTSEHKVLPPPTFTKDVALQPGRRQAGKVNDCISEWRDTRELDNPPSPPNSRSSMMKSPAINQTCPVQCLRPKSRGKKTHSHPKKAKVQATKPPRHQYHKPT